MYLSPEILNELKAISPMLAGLEKTNVFRAPEGYFDELHLRIADYAILNNTSAVDNINKRNLQQVPEGYFDTLSASILAKVRAAYPETAEEELRRLSPTLSALKNNVFTVPEGYFESFAEKTIERLRSQVAEEESAGEELRRLSPMLSTLKGNVFSVPEGYFESFAENTIQRLTSQDADFESAGEELGRLSPMLSTLKGNVFSVPEGYFESFAENTMQRLTSQDADFESAGEELHKLSPMLSTLKGNVFSVPDGYFESFAENLATRLQPQPAKIITMKRRGSWLKYAAAAVVTGIIATTSLQIFNSSTDINTGRSVASELPADVKASFQYKTEDDLNAGIAKLSDDDIIKYLEKNGDIMDNELLTNDLDASEMPSESDYLNDENTLNTYLDKIDDKNGDKSTP